MYASTPTGQTPPAPGLENEEPELMVEPDIPGNEERHGNGRGEADPRPVTTGR
jgi:hypothetical protein